MESCRPAIIVSFGVTAHCGRHSPSVSAGDGWSQCSRNRFRGRVSCLMPFDHPRFETPRSALVPQAFLPVFFRGCVLAILISDIRATAEVCPCSVNHMRKKIGFERNLSPSVGQVPDVPDLPSAAGA